MIDKFKKWCESSPSNRFEKVIDYLSNSNLNDNDFAEMLSWYYSYYRDHSDKRLRKLFDRLNGKQFNDYTDNDELIEKYNSLPSMVRLYRGCKDVEVNRNKIGISWSFNYRIASKFANHPKKNSREHVYTILIPKERIKSLITSMREDEAIVTDVEKDEVSITYRTIN